MFFAIKKRPLLFLFALFTISLLSFLGHWQYQKGVSKEISDKLHAKNLAQQEINLNELDDQTKQSLENGMTVTLKGHFIGNKIILHDNRLNLGKAGYHVYSIFELNTHEAVLINRGWVAVGTDRRVLPKIETDDKPTEITGYIRYPVKGVFTLGKESLVAKFPLRIQTLEIEKISKVTAYQLESYTVLLSEAVEGKHFSRKWKDLLPGKYMTADKHFAYAIQWYSLGFLGFVIFMVLMVKMAKNEQN